MGKLSFTIQPNFKDNLFQFARRFNHVVWLDSHSAVNGGQEFETLVALGALQVCTEDTSSYAQLESFLSAAHWSFGYFAYDFKNPLEPRLSSANNDGLGFPDFYFFEPELLIQITAEKVNIESGNENLLKELVALNDKSDKVYQANLTSGQQIKQRTSKQDYLAKIEAIKTHIKRGDIYEVNFCHEFFVENSALDPFDFYQELARISPTPFASFSKLGPYYSMGASPERFLKKVGKRLFSQPIKGTIRRGKTVEEDEKLKSELAANPKERSENVMIVDLVRNDLSQVAIDGSVKVEELCGIYTFPQVHQMISTVSCEVEKDQVLSIISKCFPMGSMTGAPKLRAMELIEEFEDIKRGLFSGSMGYITPAGDFDFNVVIRTLLYNEQKKYLSFSVGGAITMNADPEQEYQETLLKAKAIAQLLHQDEKD